MKIYLITASCKQTNNINPSENKIAKEDVIYIN